MQLLNESISSSPFIKQEEAENKVCLFQAFIIVILDICNYDRYFDKQANKYILYIHVAIECHIFLTQLSHNTMFYIRRINFVLICIKQFSCLILIIEKSNCHLDCSENQ